VIPLHTGDGGHSVHGGIAFPLERNCTVCRGQCPVPAECQLPIAAAEPGGTWSVAAQVVLIAIAVICVAAAVYAFAY
jgi:hypothetical protein